MNVQEAEIRSSLVKDPAGDNLKYQLYVAIPGARAALLAGMGYADPKTHMTRIKVMVDTLARNIAPYHDVMPPLMELASLHDAQWVLSSLADIDPTNEYLDRLRELADRQTRETLILTGGLTYEDIEDAVLDALAPQMQTKEPRVVRIDFAWAFEDNRPSCSYRVYETLGPDPRVHDAVLAFLAENAALVGRAETGGHSDVQELLAKASSYVHAQTGLIAPTSTLESLLNQTSLGKRFAKDLTPTES